MTNMSMQPLWLTHFIEILLVLEFQLKKFIVGTFSYKAHFRPQISSNAKTMWIHNSNNSCMDLQSHNFIPTSNKYYNNFASVHAQNLHEEESAKHLSLYKNQQPKT